MPLFGQSEGANTLYIARSSVAGDHQGRIAEFEPVDLDEQRRLPHGESIALDVGDAWHDVFLWNDVAYVGTPEQLWDDLVPVQGDLESRAPLSLLELAVHAGRDEVVRLAPVAFDFVQEKFGGVRARGWRRQFVRQLLETAIRRVLVGREHALTASQAVAVVERTPGVLSIDLPGIFARALLEKEPFQQAFDGIAKLATLLGAELTPLSSDASAVVEQKPEGLTDDPPGPPPKPATPPAQTEALIIADGRRAREIASHLRRGEGDMLPSGSHIHVAASAREWRDLLSRTGFIADVIVIVLDEDDQEPEMLPDLDAFVRRQAAEGALIVVAPALPANHPSRLFDIGAKGSRLPSESHAILDSAIARSPFWWGKSKRSFDRRIADVIALAIVACRSPVVRRELMDRPGGEPTPVLAVGLMPKAGDSETLLDGPGNLRLGSEVSWVSGDPKRSDPAILFSARINPRDVHSYEIESQVLVEGRRRGNRFPEFAARVLAPIFSSRRGAPARAGFRLEQSQVDNSPVSSALSMPDYSTTFTVANAASTPFNLVVTGETPTLDVIETASRAGWRVARYTDTATLRRLADVERPVTFPDEVDIGPVRSHAIHRRLAARGVDQRDVIRISYDLSSEWLDGLPQADRQSARTNLRPMRSATRPYGEPNSDLLLTRDFVLGDQAGASRLRDLLELDSRTKLAARPLKRSADLVRCWTAPPRGFQRYAIVDGAVPVVVVEMRDDEVPVQDLFVIDGDLAVPTLFRSRVFAVWARATLPPASSWMARFSVVNTFGGFPIVPPFRIIQEESAVALVAQGAAQSRLEELTREVNHHIERAVASHPPSGWKAAHRVTDTLPAMAQLNQVILDFYGLPGDADDVVILRRLQQMNAELD
ncbi:hypothetical protein [Mesorhizobium sp. M1406]|uniref:hypothetical protein n=1 Tax=Mesorhizobium sp. M1406 TaxID=2957099 RepID=UPI003334C1C2